jgi:hypothetical protein
MSMDDEMFVMDIKHGSAPSGNAHPVEATALLGNAAVLIWNDVAPEGRDAFYRWHDREHIPERLALPGFLRGRRLACTGHSPEWLTIYEADDLDVLTSPEYLARLNNPTPATTATLRHFRNTSRAICSILHTVGSSTGGFVLTLRIEMPDANVAAFVQAARDEIFPAAMQLTGVLACHLFACDQLASHIDTTESSTRAFDVPSHVLVVETSTRNAAEAARQVVQGPVLARCEVYVRPDAAVYQLEICRLPSRAGQR